MPIDLDSFVQEWRRTTDVQAVQMSGLKHEMEKNTKAAEELKSSMELLTKKVGNMGTRVPRELAKGNRRLLGLVFIGFLYVFTAPILGNEGARTVLLEMIKGFMASKGAPVPK